MLNLQLCQGYQLLRDFERPLMIQLIQAISTSDMQDVVQTLRSNSRVTEHVTITKQLVARSILAESSQAL